MHHGKKTAANELVCLCTLLGVLPGGVCAVGGGEEVIQGIFVLAEDRVAHNPLQPRRELLQPLGLGFFSKFWAVQVASARGLVSAINPHELHINIGLDSAVAIHQHKDWFVLLLYINMSYINKKIGWVQLAVSAWHTVQKLEQWGQAAYPFRIGQPSMHRF